MLDPQAPCTSTPSTEAERRSALQPYPRDGIAHFIALAAELGAVIRIVEDQPFLIGAHGMGDQIGGDRHVLVWHLAAPELTGAQRQLLERAWSGLNLAPTFPTFTYPQRSCTK